MATEAANCRAVRERRVRRGARAWLRGYVAMWLCGYVATWLCGCVARRAVLAMLSECLTVSATMIPPAACSSSTYTYDGWVGGWGGVTVGTSGLRLRV